MNDIKVKFLGHSVGSGLFEINGDKRHFTTNYQVLGMMNKYLFDGTSLFDEIVKKYISTLNEYELNELERIINERQFKITENKPKRFGSKWDGYTQ